MTFNPNIPQPNDLISASQAQIQTNFAQADTAFGIDHTPFSTLANQGQHKQVTLIAPIANPNQAGNISSVYTKTSGTGVELFYQHGTANNGVSQLTGGGVTAAAWCYYDGTNLVNSFNVSSVVYGGGGGFTVNFTRPFTNGNYAVIVTLDIDGTGKNATGILITARNAAFVTWTSRAQDGSTFQFPFSAVFFGVLA
jgi:hypothetical protein